MRTCENRGLAPRETFIETSFRRILIRPHRVADVLPNFGQNCSRSGHILPFPDQSLSNGASLGEIGRIRVKLGRARPSLLVSGQDLVDVGHTCFECGRTCVSLGQFQAEIRRCRPHPRTRPKFRRFRANLADVARGCRKFGHSWPHFGQIRTRIRSDFWRFRTDLDRFRQTSACIPKMCAALVPE